jgi:PAS domain S-box-containing protein
MNSKLQARFDSFKSAGLLPSPKGPALVVMQLTRQDNVSAAQLARAIQADPALVSRLIKLANACRSPESRPILAIKDAIGILGLSAVHGLALGFSLMSNKRFGRCRSFDYPAFWSRNLARAVAMHALATGSRIMQGDEAFTLGLLSHIGELGMASLFPEDYARLLDRALPDDGDLLTLERQTFEFDHADLTAALLADWGFPAQLIEPVACHERSAAAGFSAGSPSERLLRSLMLASEIADVCMAQTDDRRGMMTDLFLLGGKLSIGAEELTSLCDGIVREWSDWCGLLEVPSKILPPFVELMNVPAATDQPATLPDIVANVRFRVLVVDDDAIIRALLMAELTRSGYQCVEAINGQQGLELARTAQPDLMVVDWMMPGMSGIEMIRTLRETEYGRGIYILLLTALDQEDRLVEAFAAGADDFVGKPLRTKVLLGRLLAGQRVVMLHREIRRDQANLHRFATEFACLNQRLQENYQRDEIDRRRMELALSGGSLGMWDLDVASGDIVVSERGRGMFGYAPGEIKADIESWRHLVHHDDWEPMNAALQAHLKGETPAYEFEHRIRHKDGYWVWMMDRGEVVERDAAGAPLRVVGTHMDITERKALEASRARSEEFKGAVLDSVNSQIAVLDGVGVIVATNKAWNRFALENSVVPGGKAEYTHVGVNYLEVCRAGFSDSAADAQAAHDGILAVLEGRSAGFILEYPCHTPDRQLWFSMSVTPLVMDAGGVVVTHTDITTRREVEAELLRSNAELEQFSYSISHDMRQPLRMISSYMRLLETGLKDKLREDQRECFFFAIDGAKRLDAMLQALLEYSRIGRAGEPLVRTESRAALDHALLFLEPAIAEAQAAMSIEGDWPRIIANPDELLRLFQNLIGNALKFRVAGRGPEIIVTSHTGDAEWRVSVTDNGIGIAAAQAGRLFQMFQRLQARDEYEGTGIGLALCRKIVEHHGGRIWVEPASGGQGSTFSFSMPFNAREAE